MAAEAYWWPLPHSLRCYEYPSVAPNRIDSHPKISLENVSMPEEVALQRIVRSGFTKRSRLSACPLSSSL